MDVGVLLSFGLTSRPKCATCSEMRRQSPMAWDMTLISFSLQSLSYVILFVIPWTAAHQASLSITNSQNLLKLMSTESVMPSNHLILCRPLLLPPLVFPSIGVFSDESFLCIRWSKYWSFSFSISPSSEHSGLISLRMDWLGLLAVQGTLRSLLKHHSSSAYDCKSVHTGEERGAGERTGEF